MKRSLLAIASSFLVSLFLAALPAWADDQSFQIDGVDSTRGPFTGQLTLSDTDQTNEVEAVREVEFEADGTTQIQKGTLTRRGQRLRGVLRESNGLAGSVRGRRRGRGSLVTVRVSEDGTCEGTVLSGRGAATFEGQEIEPATEADETGASPDGSGGDSATATTPDAPCVDHFKSKTHVDFDPAVGIADPANTSYRIYGDHYDNTNDGMDELRAFLNDPNASQVETIRIGCAAPKDMIDLIVANKDELPALKAVFVADVEQEESEISWIEATDVSPLLRAFPKLEQLNIRGGNGLSFGAPMKHESLCRLLIESGGTNGSATRTLGALDLPAMQIMEIWLGTDEYGASDDVSDLDGILSGANTPKLRHLGLMNSHIQDAVARAAANAPVLDQLKVLDLSMGTLSDAGARALLDSAKVKELETLRLGHHWISDPLIAALEALSPVNASVGSREDDSTDPDDRYVSVSE